MLAEMFHPEEVAEKEPSSLPMRPEIDVLYTFTLLWWPDSTGSIVNVSLWSDSNVNSGDVKIFPLLRSSVQFSNIIAASNIDIMYVHITCFTA